MREPGQTTRLVRLLVLVVLPGLVAATACTGSPTTTAHRRASARASADRPVTQQSSVPAVATLAGRLVASAWKTSPLPGTVTARGPETYTATVGRAGQFSMTVQPGWYTVTATSPLYDDGTATCRHFGALDVPAEATTHVDVECMEK